MFILNKKKPEYQSITMQQIINKGVEMTKEKTRHDIKLARTEPGSLERKEAMENVIEYTQTVILINALDKKTLMKLFKAYDLNHLLMLEMAQDQYISKLAPYTHPDYNANRFVEKSYKKKRRDDNENSSDESIESDSEENSRSKYIDSMFYNLVFRDKNHLSK